MSGHPEFAGRLKSVWQRMQVDGLQERLIELTPKPIPEATILLAHEPSQLNQLGDIEAMSNSPLVLLDADTYMTPNSYTIARLAAGGVCMAVDAVLDGEADNALAAVRPPGHHATDTTSMGFCLINNVAIAARHAQETHGIERVMIVDYDVHHGNGTQDIFYDDDSVFFISTHQVPLYPGSGMLEETGIGTGEGATLNVPLRAGTGDAGFRQIYEEIVWPAAERFQPQLILVSAGFDAHWQDPLGGLRLSLDGFAHLTRELIRMADELCDGKIVFSMEGGYNLEVIGAGFANVARCLLGEDEIDDPLGTPPDDNEPDVRPVIDTVKEIHDLD
jgi:acetoin utilization deacetylase AcuC-like enzyme